MDYAKLTLADLKRGYRFDEKEKAYICNYCEKPFQTGQVFLIDEHFFDPEHAAAKHVQLEHDGNFGQLLHSDTKYNTLTDVQKELLALFHSGMPDSDIAKQLGVSASTVRHQKFTFREKAKQAKLYLAVYEQVFDKKTSDENAIASIHNTATMVDDRYLTTEKEKAHILRTAFESLSPLRLKDFSAKAKKKVVILARITEEFQIGRRYSEKEVTETLKPIFDDHAVLRRYLVDYGFMDRTSDGKEYWLK
jgi:DNA-binding CsgD family transcriptional regulator